MAPAAEEAAIPAVVAPPAAAPSVALSEAWEVLERHEGCYTGGKVVWSQAAKVIGCLCSEELHLVDVESKLPTRRVAHEGDGVLTYAIDPEGLNICTSHRSGLLRHFKPSKIEDDKTKPAELVRSWKGHDQVTADVCFDATGSFVATGSVDKSVKVWDFAGYFCTHSFRGHIGIVSIVRFHPAKLQVVAVADTEVRLWDLQTSSCVGVMKDHMTSISSICFAKVKGAVHHLITAGRDQVVNVWNLEDKCSIVKAIPAMEAVEGVAAIPVRALKDVAPKSVTSTLASWLKREGELPAYVVVTVGEKCQLRFWTPQGKCISTKASPHAAKGALRQVHCIDEEHGQRLMTIGEDLNLVVWSLPDLTVESYIMGQNEEIVHVQFLPQLNETEENGSVQVTSDRFVCIANDEHPRIVNSKGFAATLLRGHSDVVICADVSADGKFIATGGKDQSIRVWMADSPNLCVCNLKGHAGAVSALSFPKKRPKGGLKSASALAAMKQPLLLCSGSHDKTMKVWELPSPEKLLSQDRDAEPTFVEKSKTTVVAHGKEVNDVVVSPNNKLIASGGHDKLVRIWQFPSGDLMGECKGHKRGVWCVAFSPVDQVIASASGDTTVRLWNLRDYTAIRAFQGHSSAVLRVCFLPGGMQLMTSAVDGLLKLWQIRTSDCAGTFEEHEGKVWCIDVVGDTMVSGGSDSKLCIWKDVTAQKTQERHDEKAEAVMKDSKIGLLVREGKIEEALTLTLDLNRPGQMRQILTDHAMKLVGRTLKHSAKAPEGEDEEEGVAADDSTDAIPPANLRRWLMSLDATQLGRLVELLEQWNSNRKLASLAQMLMGLLLQVVPPGKLSSVEGLNATCGSFLSYSQRHMARVDALLQKTFLFDLVLQSGGSGLAMQKAAEEADQEASLEGRSLLPAATDSAANALKRTMDVLHADDGDEDEEPEAEDDSSDEDVADTAAPVAVKKKGAKRARAASADS
eukprot:TRINITY_DN36032_c0_g1_i1.p1 TRINITY_DN36032_c0_g1~~TRINITY_DN36032_c0_g1_i1.p1  ORF type:complete len:969 (-),score=231.23 TRINITY_DN36032_c0_g1_i1:181-3087(-)